RQRGADALEVPLPGVPRVVRVGVAQMHEPVGLGELVVAGRHQQLVERSLVLAWGHGEDVNVKDIDGGEFQALEPLARDRGPGGGSAGIKAPPGPVALLDRTDEDAPGELTVWSGAGGGVAGRRSATCGQEAGDRNATTC